MDIFTKQSFNLMGEVMNTTNDYYDLIDDEDLQVDQGYNGMILHCSKCGAMFGQKACGNRTIFPWFGYHPTDGNCKVVNSEFLSRNDRLVNKCDCNVILDRIIKKADLDKAITRVESMI